MGVTFETGDFPHTIYHLVVRQSSISYPRPQTVIVFVEVEVEVMVMRVGEVINCF